VRRYGLWLVALLTTIGAGALAQEEAPPLEQVPPEEQLPLGVPPQEDVPAERRVAPPEVAPPEDVLRGETVLSRPRLDYDPIGMRVGSFLVYPDLDIQETYENNIFASERGHVGDLITSMIPSVDVRSDWNVHALDFHADSSVNKYANNGRADFTDFTATTGGRLDIYHDARMFGGAGFLDRHESFASPNNVFGNKSPVEYQDYTGSIAGEKEFDRLSLRLDGNYDAYRYNNAATIGGGTIRESLRNYDDKRVALRTGYELAPLRQVYVSGGYDWRSYQSVPDITGVDRNSTGYQAALGAVYDLTGIMFADVFAGYREQDYEAVQLAAIKGPTGGARLTWNVTPLTTITGGVVRTIEETDIANSSGFFATRGDLRVDHELLRNLLLDATLGYERDDFKGIGRGDDYYIAGVGAKYLIDRNFWVLAGYNYANRSSNQRGNSFQDHLVFVRLSAHL
jgi:hypothetical protein